MEYNTVNFRNYNLLFVYYITETINTRKIEAFTFANGTRNSHFKREIKEMYII